MKRGLLLFLIACGGVPAAVTSPIAPSAVSVNVAPLPEPDAPRRGQRWSFHDNESRLGITSGELMATFHSRVTRFRGFISSNPDRVTIDFDLHSLENGSSVVAEIIKYDYLEVDRYPTAHVDVVVANGIAKGVLELHGVRRNIEFPITFERAPGRVRARSAFTLRRHDFDIVKLSGWDWIARENVEIDVDLVAAPERVVVEELN